jgi:hypothetical protein
MNHDFLRTKRCFDDHTVGLQLRLKKTERLLEASLSDVEILSALQHDLEYQLKKELKQSRPIHGWFCDGFMWDTNVVWVTEKNNVGDGNHSLLST